MKFEHSRPVGRAAGLVIIVTAWWLAGCGRGEPEQRRYTEVVVRPPPVEAPTNAPPPFAGGVAGGMAGGSVPSADIAVAWTAPAGWEERAGSGVRLVTFMVQGHPCTVTAFPGDVGGVEANVRRWLGQLGGPEPDAGALQHFIHQAGRVTSEAGLEGAIYDFRTLVAPAAADDASMLAAIMEKGDARVFVKLTAPASVLGEELGRFEALCRSLR